MMAKKQTKTEVRMLPVNLIHPNTFGMREHIDQDGIHDLGKSIDEAGLLEPVLVRPDPTMPGHYELIAGERRWLAHKDAGISEIPATVRDVPDDLEAMELSIAENWLRQDLTDLEKEKFLYNLWKKGGPDKKGRFEQYESVPDMARKLGINPKTLSELIKAQEERSEISSDIQREPSYVELNLTRVLSKEPELKGPAGEAKGAS